MELTRHELRVVRTALRYTLLSCAAAVDGRDASGHVVPWATAAPERETARDLMRTVDAHLDGHDRELQAELRRALEATAAPEAAPAATPRPEEAPS